jgi:hypothetical protein
MGLSNNLNSNIVNLKELSQRESERVEWKENVADIEDLIRTSVAFANDFSNLGAPLKIVMSALSQRA